MVAVTQQDETWRPVVGYEGIYEVSDLGRVRSLRYGKTRILFVNPKRGYLTVKLFRNGPRDFDIHALVAAAFIGPRPDKYDVNHIDGVKTNNRPENLEYTTRSDNMRHAHRLGLIDQRGARNPRTVLTADQVTQARQQASVGMAITEIAKSMGVRYSALWMAVRGKTWTALTGGAA